MPEQITLKTATINAVLEYLSKMPYLQVAALIQAIQQEAQGQITEASSSEDVDG
jgi:hypothetical protein